MDTNTESKEVAPTSIEKEVAPVPAHEEHKTPKVISVKMAVTIAAVIILGALAFYHKGWFIVATVNGSPISRFSVISDLEKTSGKKALDAIITKKLLNDEANKKGIIVTNDEVTAEIQKIETQVKAQGGTLDAALSAQGMTRGEMEEQITLQKKLEKLLDDKLQVTDEEVAKILVASKVTVPKGEEEKYKEQAKAQIRVQKLNAAAGAFIEELKTKVSIKYFVNY